MEIPIFNIYYLLCYAWNKLEEKDVVEVSGIDTTNLCDLFAKVLIGGTSRLLKMGIDRGYTQQSEETPCIKGKIDFGVTVKRNLFASARARCHFDELSHNILHNQVLKSTLSRLADADALSKELRSSLLDLLSRLPEIDEIPLGRSAFRRIQLHRNNSFYDFLLKICELIADNLLPSERKGQSKFMDFVRDEKQMGPVFEQFVRNFYRLEQNEFAVYREDIQWDISSGDSEFLPKMQTDISLESKSRKIVIDTKFYREALTDHYEKEKIRATNMYQMFAYLKNLEKTQAINSQCEGILLYPTVTKSLDIEMVTHGHKVSFRTVNLNQDWRGIHKDLLSLVGIQMPN